MIADVVMLDLTTQRMTLPKGISIDDKSIIRVYVGRRTARIVVESRNGRFYLRRQTPSDPLLLIPSIRAAIDAVKEPRPL